MSDESDESDESQREFELNFTEETKEIDLDDGYMDSDDYNVQDESDDDHESDVSSDEAFHVPPPPPSPPRDDRDDAKVSNV